MADSVSMDIKARRMLTFAHVILALAVLVQAFGLLLHGTQGTIFKEGLALGLFALWVSLYEGAVLLTSKRYVLAPRVQTIIDEASMFVHLLFLGVTHGITYKFLLPAHG